MWVKICANTNPQDALLAIELGADAVGFVFAPSKRQVTATQVAEIVDALPSHVLKVGVFATSDPYEIEHHIATSGLDVAQLHGAYDATLVHSLSEEFGGHLKIIQTVAYPVNAEDRAMADERFEATLREVFADPLVWAVLLDTAKSGASGGLGVAFNWKHVAEIVHRAASAHAPTPRVILAGGLHAENVADAIKRMKPWGVDVASGVEAMPGKKDPQRLRDFIEAARST